MTERRNRGFYRFTGETGINRKIRAGVAAVMLATAPLIGSPVPPRAEPTVLVRSIMPTSSQRIPDSI